MDDDGIFAWVDQELEREEKRMEREKRITGGMWPGNGKHNKYEPVEHDSQISGFIQSPMGMFWLRCKGGHLEVKMHDPDGYVVGTHYHAFHGARPGARRRK